MKTLEELFAGSPKSCSFKDMPVGTAYEGTIKSLEVRQQTDYHTKELKTFPSGDPMLQIVTELQTETRDPAIEDDDGVRTLYIRGMMMDSARAAVQRAGRKVLEPGGHLKVTFIGYSSKNPQAKDYRVDYTPPAPGADVEAALNSTPTPDAQTASAPAARGFTDDQKQQLRDMGFTEEQIAEKERAK